jgi:hypothetical protein
VGIGGYQFLNGTSDNSTTALFILCLHNKLVTASLAKFLSGVGPTYILVISGTVF